MRCRNDVTIDIIFQVFVTVTVQIVILWVDTELFSSWNKVQREAVKMSASCFAN
jgi:hypothetical protein